MEMGGVTQTSSILIPEVNKPTVSLTSSDTSHISPIILVDSISKRYKIKDQHIDALRHVSMTVGRGEMLAITGESGSGKSTLLQCIGCIDRPSSGKIVIDGLDVNRLADAKLSSVRQRTMGFVFQSFYLQPFLTVADNIAVPAMFAGVHQRNIDNRVGSLLEKVGLIDYAKRYPSQLSGGQIQRVAIARALMNNSQVILADEPTGNLDSQNSIAIIELFRRIQADFGTTIIIVTHNDEIAHKADRIIQLKDGAIV